MGKNIFLILAIYYCSHCIAQDNLFSDTIKLCYYARGDAIGGTDHCLTITFEDSLIICKRICYSQFNTMYNYSKIDLYNYYETWKQAIVLHYQLCDNYLKIDERVEISKSQIEELLKIIDEIKSFVSKVESNPDLIIISTAGYIHYYIKDEYGTVVIVDWERRYNRIREIEKALGLKSYMKCPCVEDDMKNMEDRKTRRKRRFD